MPISLFPTPPNQDVTGKGEEDWRRTWGYDFKWTPDHRTKEELAHLMYSYDELAAECLDLLDDISPATTPPQAGAQFPSGREKQPSSETPPSPQEPSLGSPRPPPPPPSSEPATTPTGNSPAQPTTTTKSSSPFHRDYFTLLKTHHASHPTLSRLWAELNTIPPWADAAQIARGQAVFYRYAGPAVVGLTFQSLLGGMGGRRVVETLRRTGGFGPRVARRRLLETFQHVLLVTRDADSLSPGGEGWASSVRVRFLHASVRRRILQLAAAAAAAAAASSTTEEGEEKRDNNKGQKRGRYYDVAQHGVPINDLDSIGTVAAFSATLIWVSLPRQGIYLKPQEKEDLVALWRLAGRLLGCPTDPYFASAAHAKATMDSLMLTEIDPSPASRVLANNIIAALAAPPRLASEGFLCAEARWLNGPALSDALGVPRPRWWYTALVGLQCVLFMVVCYASRSVPAWDRRRIEGLKGRLSRIVLALAGGGEAAHEFKYVPGLEGDDTREEGGGGKGGAGVVEGKAGVGWRYGKMLAAVGTVVAAVAWLGLRYASGVL